MASYEKAKFVAFTAIVALVGLLIVIVRAPELFPQLLFYSLVVTFTGIIIVLVAYAFLWEPVVRRVRSKLWNRKMNILAREYFVDFVDFLEKFGSLPEFQGQSKGITLILEELTKRATPGTGGPLIRTRIQEFDHILREPLTSLIQRLHQLHWKKKEMNYEFLSCIAKEFENYVALHKRLYVDFVVMTARQMGLDKITKPTSRLYSEYRDDYNQFIVAYSEFAERSRKVRLGIFSSHLKKANEL